MTFIVADRVQETTNSPGTGTATLLGAVSGYQSFSTGVGINNTTFYVIADQLGTNWEVGLGALNSTGTVLTRTTVYSSSNGGSTVNFATGTQYVWCDYPSSKAVIQGNPVNFSSIGATTAGTGAFTTLSASSTVSGAGFSNYFAAPPTIGNTTPNAGTFTALVATSITDSGLTSGRVNYATTGGLLTDSANMTFSGTALTLANDVSISGLTVGKGGGAVSSNTAIGVSSLQANTTASNNTAVGYQAGYTQTTADRNAILGTQAGYAGTTGFANAYVGYQTGYANTTGYLSAALGAYALASCSTGVQNTAIGAYALNVATGSNNVAVGKDAGVAVTTGTLNTLIGLGAGYVVTTGSKNTILGGFSGNQGGLDIRTASNYIVLSDGDGNPRLSIPTGTATATVPNATGTVMVSGNMPAFRATSTSIGSQTFASSTSTKVQFNSKIFDTNNYFDATTNYRFTPLISGYYQINATISLASAIGVISAQLYKNGSAYSSPQFPLNSGYTSGSVSDIVFLNGSTDYLEIYGYQNSGSTLTLVPNNLLVNFSGAMVRVA